MLKLDISFEAKSSQPVCCFNIQVGNIRQVKGIGTY